MKNYIVKEIKLFGNSAGFLSGDGECTGIESYEFDAYPGKVEYMSEIFKLYESEATYDEIDAWSLTDESCDDFIERLKNNKDEQKRKDNQNDFRIYHTQDD